MDLGFSLAYFTLFYKKTTKVVLLCLLFVFIPTIICFSFDKKSTQIDNNNLIISIQKILDSSYAVKAVNANFEKAKQDYRRGKIDSFALNKLEVLKESQKFDLIHDFLKKYFSICKFSDQILIYNIEKRLLLEEIKNIDFENKPLSEYAKQIKKQIEFVDYKIKEINNKKQYLIEKLKLYFKHDLNIDFRKNFDSLSNAIFEVAKMVNIPDRGFSYKLNQIEEKEIQEKASNELKQVLTEIKAYELNKKLFCIKNDIKKYYEDINYYNQVKDIFKQIVALTDNIRDVTFGAAESTRIREDYIYALSEINDIKWKIIDRNLKLLSLGQSNVKVNVNLPDLKDGRLPLLKDVINLALNHAFSIKKNKLVYDAARELETYHKRYLPGEFLSFSDLYLKYRQLKAEEEKDEIVSKVIAKWYKLLFSGKKLRESRNTLQGYKKQMDILHKQKVDEFKLLNSELTYLKKLINFKQKQKDFFESFIDLENTVQVNVSNRNKEDHNDILFSSKVKNEISKIYKFHKGISKEFKYLENRIIEKTKDIANKGFWIDLDFYNNEIFKDINNKIDLAGFSYCKSSGLYQIIRLSDKNREAAIRIQNMIQNKLIVRNKIAEIKEYNDYLFGLQNLQYSEELLNNCVKVFLGIQDKRDEIQSGFQNLKYNSLDLLYWNEKLAKKEENYYKYLTVYIEDLLEIMKYDYSLRPREPSEFKVINLSNLTGFSKENEFLKFPENKILSIEVNAAQDILKNITEGFSRLKQKQLPYILQRQRLNNKIKLSYLISELKILNLSILKFNEFYSLVKELLDFIGEQYEFAIVDLEQVEEVREIKFSIREKIFKAEREYNRIKTEIKNLVGLNENYKLTVSGPGSIESIMYILKIKDIDRFIQLAIDNDPNFKIEYLKMGYFSLGELASFKLNSVLEKHVETDSTLMQIRENVNNIRQKIYTLQVDIDSELDILKELGVYVSKIMEFLSEGLEDYKKGAIFLDSGYGIKNLILDLSSLLDNYYNEYLQYETAQQELLQLAKSYGLWPKEIRVKEVDFSIPGLSMHKDNTGRINKFVKSILDFFTPYIVFESKQVTSSLLLFMKVDITNIVEKVQLLFSNVLNRFKDLFLNFKDRFIVFPETQKERDERRNFWKQQVSKRLKISYERKKEIQNNLKKYKSIGLDFDKAQDKEYMMAVFLDNWWEELKEQNAVIKNILDEYKILLDSKPKSIADNLEKFILLSKVEVPFYYRAQLVIASKDLNAVLCKIIDNYLKRFKLYKVDEKEFVENFILVANKLNEEKDCNECLNIPLFYSTYIRNILPSEIKALVKKKIDFDYIGFVLFYTHLISYCQQDGQCLDILNEMSDKGLKNLKRYCLNNRIRGDLKYLKMDIEDASLNEIKEYLRWKRYSESQFFKVTFSNISRLEVIKAHRIMQENDYSWLKMPYGDLKIKSLQENIYRWLLSKGFNLDKLSDVLKVVNMVHTNVIELYPETTISQAVKDTDQVLLRSLVKQWGQEQELRGLKNYLLSAEFNSFKKSYFYGNLISLSNFVLDNDIEDINLLFDLIVFIKELDSFKDIFGEVLLSNPNSKFYQSILINFVQEALNLLKETEISEFKKYISDKIKFIGILHNSEGFKSIYGDFDLKTPYVNDYSDNEIDNYLGKLSFHAKWALELNLNEEYIKNYFRNLSVFVKSDMKQKLYDFYDRLNISVDLDLNQPNDELREEVLGIYQSWLNFFSLRGFKSIKELENGLDLINFIAELNDKYRLKFNQDQIKYWFVRKFKEGYSNDVLNKIFSNINKAKYIFKNTGQKLIKELKESNLSNKLSKEFCNKLIKNIKILSNQIVPLGEAQRLAEQVMFKSGVNYEGLFKDYSLGMYIQANYMVLKKEKLPPLELTKKIDMFKQYGFDKYMIKEFVGLSIFMIQKENDFIEKLPFSIKKEYPKITDSEISGFLIDLFNKQSNGYYKWIDRWWNKVEFVQKEFYKEHDSFLDFAVLASLINYDLMRKKDWQIERIIKQGRLSEESENVNLINLGQNLNIERNFLRWNLITNWELLSTKQLNEYKKARDIVSSYGISLGEQRKILKKTVEEISLFKMKLMEILNNALDKEKYFKKEYMKKIDFVADKISSQFTIPVVKWIKNNKTVENMERREIRLKRQKNILKNRKVIVPKNNEFSDLLVSVEKRRNIKNLLYSKAKQLYKIELSPASISSLIWKLQEGYDIDKVLEIYVKFYNKITKLYKNIFDVYTITAYDDRLISYFSEQVGLDLLDWENLVGMFKVAARVKHRLEEILNTEMSIEQSLYYAYKLFYSGATLEIIDSIMNEVNKIKDILEKNFPVEFIYKDSDKFLGNSRVNIEKIICLITDIKDIEFQVSGATNIYSAEDYIKEIRNGIKEYELNSYWNSEKIITEIALRLKSCNLSPGWWRLILYKGLVVNNFIKEQLNVDAALGDIIIYLDYAWPEVFHRLNLYKLRPWYMGRMIGQIKIFKIEELINKSFKSYLENKLDKE